MAQESWKMNSDEMGCQPPEGPMLCSNNCGFFGSSSTMNLCSQCYRDALLKQAKVAEVAAAISVVRSQTSAEKGASQDKDIVVEAGSSLPATSEVADTTSEGTSALLEQPSRKVNRCVACNKRVGLAGIKCRCGGLFCSLHRYNDKHDCPYDYKAAGQSSIRKSNPVIKADKIDKI